MLKDQKNRLFRNFSSLGIIQVANFLLSLVVIPFVVRRVGADGFGIIAVAQVVVFYLSVLTDYGFNRTAIRDIAIYRHEKGKISQVFFTVLASKLLISLFAFVLLFLLVWLIPFFRQHMAVYLLAFPFVIGQVFLINWFFQGLERMHFMAVASLFSRLLFVVLVLFFIKDRNGTALYIFFMGLGNIIAGLVSIYFAVKWYHLKWTRPTRAGIYHEIQEGWQVTLSNISMTTCQYSGLFILRLFTNDTVVGYYSLAEKVYFAMKLMLDVFTQSVYPRVCRLLQEGMEMVIAFFRQAYLPFLVLVVVGSAIVFAMAPIIIGFLLGHPHEHTAYLLRMLCMATVVVCLNIPACLLLLAGDHKKNYLRIFAGGTLLNIAANLLLAPVLEATGTVLSVIITELFITAGLYWESYRIYKLRAGGQQVKDFKR